jgi:PIN domain nuclease of toxin-antitoxin system
MRYLLDTHVLLWWRADDPRLPHRWDKILGNIGANDVLFSVASLWEIAIKQALGKLSLEISVSEFSQQLQEDHGFRLLGIEAASLDRLVTLPHHHRPVRPPPHRPSPRTWRHRRDQRPQLEKIPLQGAVVVCPCSVASLSAVCGSPATAVSQINNRRQGRRRYNLASRSAIKRFAASGITVPGPKISAAPFWWRNS